MPKHVHDTPFIIEPEDDFLEKFPQLRQLSRHLAIRYAHRELVTDEHLTTLGSTLWNALDIDHRFEQAQGKCGTAILPIVIKSSSAAVQSLPWETLHHPQYGFLGKEAGFTLSRQFGDPANPPPLEKGPLRILLFTSLPDDLDPETARLNVEEEQAQMQEALLHWIGEGVVDLKMPDDGRFSTLKSLLKSYKPHLLFLSGHGHFKNGKLTETASYGEFLFETEKGKSALVRDDEIAQAFIGSNLQAVILSACESSKASSDALTDGLSQKLSLRGIPHVIGMRESISDKAGIQFAHALSAAFAQGERMDIALQEARLAIEKPFKNEDTSRRDSALNPAAELSFGQWSLPMLISALPERPLIDWNFENKIKKERISSKSLESISLPPRFIGRRSEMRQYKSQLFDGKLKNLLIIGAGGQGKTSLAGKLALDFQKSQYRVFAWSARMENTWGQFEFQMELALGELGQQYDRVRTRFPNEEARITYFLDLLSQRFGGKLLFFLDNLESLQDPNSLALNDEKLALWLNALQANAQIILLATSRWALPNWQGERLSERLSLKHTNYGDFLQMAQELAIRDELPKSFLARKRLRKVYKALGGNGRGLDLFAAAIKLLGEEIAENKFLNALTDAQNEIKTDMAIATIYEHLPPAEQALLRRLPLYQHPVPTEGVQKLGEGPEAKKALKRLLAVSLVEVYEESRWQVLQYQISPLVAEWLLEKGLIDTAANWRNLVADYQLFLYKEERPILTQAIILHAALERAGRQEEADRLALDRIVGALNRAGLYQNILQRWLPMIAKSNDKKTRAEAIGQIGKQYHHIGDYATALDYLKKSLAIQKEIGDKAGEGATLNNISQIYDAQGDYATALDYLKKSLAIRQEIGDKAGEGATLNNISALYHAQGDYATALDYLKKSLAIQKEIGDKAGEGTTLNNISQIYDAQGDYATALDYLKKSLAIRQEIGDKAGLCATLINMGHIHYQNKEAQEAFSVWVTAYVIAKEINYAQALQALANFAPQLGLAEGLAGWDDLAKRIEAGEEISFDSAAQKESSAKDEQQKLETFIQAMINAAKENAPEAKQYFDDMSKLAGNQNAPPELRELAKVLQKILMGVKTPDLSGLPNEMQEMVRTLL